MMKKQLFIFLILFSSLAGYSQSITPQYTAAGTIGLAYTYPGKSPSTRDTLWNSVKSKLYFWAKIDTLGTLATQYYVNTHASATSFIQNQLSTAQTANWWINGFGVVGNIASTYSLLNQNQLIVRDIPNANIFTYNANGITGTHSGSGFAITMSGTGTAISSAHKLTIADTVRVPRRPTDSADVANKRYVDSVGIGIGGSTYTKAQTDSIAALKGSLTQQNTNTANIASNYTSIGLKQPRIISALPAQTLTRPIVGDSVNAAIAKLRFRGDSISSAIGTKATQLKYYGSIYSNSNFTSLSGFTNNGATVSAASGQLQFSGGTGAFNQSLTYTYGTALEKHKQTVTQIVGTVSGTSYGVGPIMYSTNTGGYGLYNLSAYLDVSSGATAGKLQIFTGSGASQVVVAASTATVPFIAGDTIITTMERLYNQITATAYNKTQKSALVSVTYNYATLFSATYIMPNTGQFGIGSFGGAQNVIGYSIYSSELKKATIAFIGDSKAVGYYSGSISNRYASLVGQKFKSIVLAGGYDKTSDVILHLPEVIALSPANAVVSIGCNDTRTGVLEATIEANINTIYTTLTAAGINVYFLLPLYENNAVDQATLKAFFIANYASRVIDTKLETYAGTASNILVADNIHPNSTAHQIVANAIIESGIFTNASYSNDIASLSGGIVYHDGTKIATDQTKISYEVTNKILQLGTSTGGNIQSIGSTGIAVTGGGYYNTNGVSPAYIATTTNPSGISFFQGTFAIATNRLATPGSAYNPVPRIQGDSTGYLRFNPSILTGTNAWYQFYNPSVKSTFQIGSSLYATSVSSGFSFFSDNNYYNGSNWIATSATPMQFGSTSGGFNIYGNTGATIGASFTPTLQYSFTPTSALFKYVTTAGLAFFASNGAITSVTALPSGTTATTQAAGTNNTTVATSAQLFAERSNAFTLTNKVIDGTNTATTQAAGDNTTKLATTAHVFAERTNTATLTNKTLTSPQINTPLLNTTSIVNQVWTATNTAGAGNWATPGVTNRSHTIFTPTTGGTVTLVANQYNIINPAGALVALTVTLPSSPANNDTVQIKFTQAVTTVTYNGGTVADGITSPIAGGYVIFTYDTASTTWY